MTSTDRSKPRPVTLHVDVGPDLKQAVAAAASASGVRPSDWVRDALQRVLDARAMPAAGQDHEAPVDPVATRRRRVTDIRLESDDVALLDEVVARAGFRSRSAALRYLLRVLSREAGVEVVDALAQLPRTIPALTDSNVALQRWLARHGTQAVDACSSLSTHDPSADGMDARLVREHLETVARVVAALRPLLVIRPTA